MISDSSHQFYLLVGHHAICKEHEKREGEYEKHVGEN